MSQIKKKEENFKNTQQMTGRKKSLKNDSSEGLSYRLFIIFYFILFLKNI